LELEEVFSSATRMKILKLIYTLGSLNVSDVARRIKMNYAATAKHLKLLEQEEFFKNVCTVECTCTGLMRLQLKQNQLQL